MRHAYLIMAHNQPELLKKILSALDHPDNDFFLHIDAKSSMVPEEFRECIQKGRIYFTERVSVVWAHFSMVEAVYALIEKAISICEHDYYHMITGQDFPLKSADEINEFFIKNAGKEFIHFCSDDFSKMVYPGRLLTKCPLLKRCGRTRNFWYYINLLLSLAQRGFYKITKPKWSAEKYLAGSMFFSITEDFAKHLIKCKPEVYKMYKYSLSPDESFVQTVVFNSRFRDNLYIKERSGDIRGNMRYIDWTKGSNGSPTTITVQEVPAALASGMLFTRKVDIINHPDAIELLENAIRK